MNKHPNSKQPFERGDFVTPTTKNTDPNCTQGELYQVAGVDSSDSTIRICAMEIDEFGAWCNWDHFSKVEVIGWEWLKTELPAEVVDLLSAFRGVEKLRLHTAIKDTIVASQSDLKRQIKKAIRTNDR